MTPAHDTESVESLREQVAALRRQVTEQSESAMTYRAEAWFLKKEVAELRKGNWSAANEQRFQCLQNKVNRQRAAINKIQRRGWEPKYIIFEESLI